MHMSAESENLSVLVDSSLWEEASQGLQYAAAKYYLDKEYDCWHCQKPCVFSASDQKYTYEVLKASRNQRRILCNECWKLSLKISEDIDACELKWNEQKVSLEKDNDFLNFWLQQLLAREMYVPYKPNTAIKNMLNKLIAKNA